MCTGKLSHRACTRSCASHIHTHTNSAHGRVWRSIANDLRDIGRHVRSILPNGSSNFHFAPVMPTYVCPSFLSSFSISLSLSLPRVCYFRPISLPLPRGAIHILGIQKGERERERATERKRERGRKFTDFKNRPDFPPLWNCLGCAPSDDWQPLFLSFSILLPSPILVLTTVRCAPSSPPRFFKIGRPDEIRSSPLLSCISLSLFFSLWSREASLRLTLSWRTPDSSWGSSSTEAKFRADARERRKGDEVSFPNDPRTIHKLWKMSQPSRV